MTPFLATIRDQRGGKTSAELDELLADIVAAVRETGKAGKLTLTLTVSPLKKGVPGHTLLVSDKVKADTPTFDRQSSVFFADDDNTLSRSDTRQRQLPGLVDVDHDTGLVTQRAY